MLLQNLHYEEKQYINVIVLKKQLLLILIANLYSKAKIMFKKKSIIILITIVSRQSISQLN